VERRDDGAFLGMCGLHHQESYPDDVEVAWRLAREHWGRGYATEAATGWLDHAFGALKLPRVISITEPPNLRILAVMRRLGMVFDHEPRSRTWEWSSRPWSMRSRASNGAAGP
jgi:RimJ/RimL family protein N-acetyltransferase